MLDAFIYIVSKFSFWFAKRYEKLIFVKKSHILSSKIYAIKVFFGKNSEMLKTILIDLVYNDIIMT